MSPSPSRASETILVVDDEPEILGFIADALQLMGYTVHRSRDPVEALRWARDHREHLHLLVTDIVMPLMNGYELSKRLRAMRPDVKVLFMSGAGVDIAAGYGVRLGSGDPLLLKPFSVRTLASKVRATLEQRSPFSRPPPSTR